MVTRDGKNPTNTENLGEHPTGFACKLNGSVRERESRSTSRLKQREDGAVTV